MVPDRISDERAVVFEVLPARVNSHPVPMFAALPIRKSWYASTEMSGGIPGCEVHVGQILRLPWWFRVCGRHICIK